MFTFFLLHTSHLLPHQAAILYFESKQMPFGCECHTRIDAIIIKMFANIHGVGSKLSGIKAVYRHAADARALMKWCTFWLIMYIYA